MANYVAVQIIASLAVEELAFCSGLDTCPS